MPTALFALAALTAVMLTDKMADASCYSGTGSGTFWNTLSVKVYVHHTAQTTPGAGQGLRWAFSHNGYTIDDVTMGVRRTLHALNEEAGGRIKLDYAGTTSSYDPPEANSIVLRSHTCARVRAAIGEAIG
jgi:hypothetical protein